jgi:hypothetical protein
MRLYSSKIPIIARDIIRQLTSAGDIEVNNFQEAEMDIQSVLKEYLRLERDVTNEAKDIMERRALAHDQFGKVKRTVAEQKELPLGEEGLSYMCNQMAELLMASQFVDEIFASDANMRKSMKEILRRNMLVDEELDAEVRQRIRNLTEGSADWDVEYSKMMDQLKRNRGLEGE